MNYYSYLYGDEDESMVLDSREDYFPKRIRTRKMLIDYVSLEQAKQIIEENVSLIRTIDIDLHERIAKYILKVFQGYYTRENLVSYLERVGDVDEDRAELIADDQINKTAERLLVEKWKKRGCKMVRWEHMGADEPRDYHLRRWNGISGKRNGRPNGLNGFIFQINKPPVIDLNTNERGYPGQLINCHCRLVPLWE